MGPVQMAALGTGFTFLMTAAGAAVVFSLNGRLRRFFSGCFWDLRPG